MYSKVTIGLASSALFAAYCVSSRKSALSKFEEDRTESAAVEAFQALSKGASARSIRRFHTLCSTKELKTAVISYVAKNVDPKKFAKISPLIPITFLDEEQQTFSLHASKALKSFTETFLRAHDFASSNPPPSDRWEANRRLSDLYQLILVPWAGALTLYGTLTWLTNRKWLSAAITSASLIGGVKLIRWADQMQPVGVHRIASFEDLTEKAIAFTPIEGRSKEIEEIRKHLNGLRTKESSLLLLGETGVGKSQIVRELARQVAVGEIPELQGVSICSINTADLKDHGGGIGERYATRLELLLQDIDTAPVILFLDEVHTAGTNRDNGAHGTDLDRQLQTLFDQPNIHIIAATTTDEYKKYLKENKALDRRFTHMEIGNLPKEILKESLKKLLHRDYPGVSEDVLEDLPENFAKAEKQMRAKAKEEYVPSEKEKAWHKIYNQFPTGSREQRLLSEYILPSCR